MPRNHEQDPTANQNAARIKAGKDSRAEKVRAARKKVNARYAKVFKKLAE